jgi:anaerobic magnesium-protoporphyrin IX monomethyl ester cyclase
MGVKALLAQSPATSAWTPRRQWEPPSVGLATIAAHTGRHDVRVLDMVVWRRHAASRFVKLLETFRPRVVGFTAMTFQYETALQFAALAKQFDSGILTVLGGYHATLYHEELALLPDARYWDFILRGEGDFAFGELLDGVENNPGEFGEIAGLSWKKSGVFVHNVARPLEDITRIRIPDRGKRLLKGFHMYFRSTDVIETSRGCLHACNFCSIREMYGKSFRMFPLDRVLADIEDAYARGARHISCADDNITLDMDRFEALLDGVIGLKLRNLEFTTQASPIGFAQRPGIASKMVDAGFVSIFLGIENASTKSLRSMNKPNTIDLIKRGVAELQSQNIIVIAGLINGLAHDDADSIRENYEFVRDLGISSVMDQILTPYPKTALRAEMLDANMIANRTDFRWYDGYFSNVRTDHLSPEELGFVRWKTRRDVIGMWRPSPGDWKHFKGYTYLWEFGLRHIVWLNERLLEGLFGVEGRYKLQLRQYLQLNDFGIEVPDLPKKPSYHPILGNGDDPMQDRRWQLLRRRLPFLPTDH